MFMNFIHQYNAAQQTLTGSKSITETDNSVKHCSVVFIVNFEHILHLFIVFLLLPLNR